MDFDKRLLCICKWQCENCHAHWNHNYERNRCPFKACPNCGCEDLRFVSSVDQVKLISVSA